MTSVYIGENTLKPLSLQKTMSTANVQNLLSNVFHPTFVYDTANQVYKSKLELVNIDTVSANTVSTFFASVGDSRSNVYVGIGAGNPYSNLVASSNWYTTCVGGGAGNGSSNASNCVFIGYNAGQGSVNSTNTIAIGSNADGDGSNNIYIGAGAGMAGAAGTSNIFIGHGNTLTGVTKQFLLGPLVGQPPSSLTNSLGSNYLLGGDFASNRLGINLSNPTYNLDVNGYARIGTNSVGGLGVNTNPVDYTLNVNGDMQVSDGYGRLRLTHDSNGSGTAGYSRMSLVGITNAGGSPAAVGIATLQVTDGYFSASGTTTAGVASNVPLKRGMIAIVADNGTDADQESYLIHVGFDASTSGLRVMAHSSGTSNSPIFPDVFLFIAAGTTSTPSFTVSGGGGPIIPGMRLTTASGTYISMISAVTYSSSNAGSLSLSASLVTPFGGSNYFVTFGTTVGRCITFSGSNIVISNASAVKYSVTYFHTP